jgi:hypothetical protein
MKTVKTLLTVFKLRASEEALAYKLQEKGRSLRLRVASQHWYSNSKNGGRV